MSSKRVLTKEFSLLRVSTTALQHQAFSTRDKTPAPSFSTRETTGYFAHFFKRLVHLTFWCVQRYKEPSSQIQATAKQSFSESVEGCPSWCLQSPLDGLRTSWINCCNWRRATCILPTRVRFHQVPTGWNQVRCGEIIWPHGSLTPSRPGKALSGRCGTLHPKCVNKAAVLDLVWRPVTLVSRICVGLLAAQAWRKFPLGPGRFTSAPA